MDWTTGYPRTDRPNWSNWPNRINRTDRTNDIPSRGSSSINWHGVGYVISGSKC